MEVDLYSLCPCGSGKKIKFCKCHDTIGDLDKIGRMVEGGQMVAALDRTNQVLAEHPDAAWALAIKGRLLLRLRENDQLAENALRFLRLQPSNPLALLQKAAAELGKGEVREATSAVLQALAESRETHDSLLFEISTALGAVMAENANFLSARAFLAMSSMAEVPSAEMAAQINNEITQNRTINLLLKHLPETIGAPASAAWLERFSEASRLLEVNSVLLAESKYQALDRQFPGQAAIVSGLLRCAIWRGDQADQAKLLSKLADISTIPEEDRDYYRATSYLVEPGQVKLTEKSRDLVWEFGEVDATLAGLTLEPKLLALSPDMVRDMVFEEGDVPPRAAYQLLDRAKPDSDSLPSIDETPEVLGMLLVYGRQTDRPARLLVINVTEQNESEVRRIVSMASGGTLSEPQVVEEQVAPLSSTLFGATPALRLRNLSASDLSDWQRRLFAQRIESRLMQSRIALFNGKTVAEAANDASLKPQLSALMRVVEGYDTILSEATENLQKIRERLGVVTLPEIDLAGRKPVSLPVYKLYRVRPGAIGAEDSWMLLERSRMSACYIAMKRFAEHLLGLSLGKDLLPTKIMAYMTLAECDGNVKSSLERLEQGKQWAKENQIPAPALLLSEIGYRIHAGDPNGLQRCIQSIVTDYSNNPNVMAQLQQILVSYGILNPDGSPRRAPGGASSPLASPAPAAGSGSKLWTPDGPDPAAKPSGGSKLWVPGMD